MMNEHDEKRWDACRDGEASRDDEHRVSELRRDDPAFADLWQQESAAYRELASEGRRPLRDAEAFVEATLDKWRPANTRTVLARIGKGVGIGAAAAACLIAIGVWTGGGWSTAPPERLAADDAEAVVGPLMIAGSLDRGRQRMNLSITAPLRMFGDLASHALPGGAQADDSRGNAALSQPSSTHE